MDKNNIKIGIIMLMTIILVVLLILLYSEINQQPQNSQESAQELLTQEPTAAEIANNTPAPTPVRDEVFFETLVDVKTRFLTSTYNGNLIWLNEERNIVMQDKDSGDKTIIKAFEDEDRNEKRGNELFTVRNGDAKEAEVYYTKLLHSSTVPDKYEEVFNEYFSNAPMSELHSTKSNEPLIDFVMMVIDCKDDKIIYLNENFEVYEFNMVNHESSKLYDNRDEYFSIYRQGFYKYEDYTLNHLIDYISEESVVTIQKYQVDDDFTIDYDTEILEFPMPYNGYVKRVVGTNENIYICYGDTYNEETYSLIYILNVNTNDLKIIADNTYELESVYGTDGNLFISYRINNDVIKVLLYNSELDQLDVIYEGQPKNESIDEYLDRFVTHMVYENGKLLGYCYPEGGRNSLMFELDID